MFVVYSILIKPVVDGSLEVDVITKVSWSGGSDKELGFIWDAMIAVELHISASIIFADEPKVLNSF